tara:strand:+ start:205 stop:3924 length:3720 start_codon:yes stop_codon:yes gene_type:complete
MELSEITILDANQKFSSEFLGGNNSNALFTNKMGHGIEVQPGDKISIYNSFIAEAGATTDAIEITDKFLGTREIVYTQLTPVNYINGSNEKPLGYERVTASNITETVNMSQNNVDILTNYYKTTNGENYFSLPRRYCIEGDGLSGANTWKSTDDITQGRCYNNGILNTEIGANKYNGSFEQVFVCDADYFFFSDNGSGAVGNDNVNEWKLRGDNSRYTIFVREDTRYGQQTDMINLNNTLVSVNTSGTETNGLYSPSEYPYIEYIEKVNINIQQGFVSPSALAENISNQLKEQQEPQINYFSSILSQPGSPSPGYETFLPMSVELNSKTYHTFWSSGTRLSNQVNWTAWNSKLNASVISFNSSLTNNYLSQFQYIGVKRPDLFKAGRVWAANSALNQPGLLTQAYFRTAYDLHELNFTNSADINGNVAFNNLPNHTITTKMEWGQPASNKTMEYIRDIINAQENYPELFDNKFNQYQGLVTVNNSRFLHMNVSKDGTAPGERNTPISTVGWDYMTDGTNGCTDNASSFEYKSTPLFFDYNPKYKNIDTDGESWETGYKYGIFKKVLYSGTYYVALTTSHIGIGTDGTDIENFSVAVGSGIITMTGFNTSLFENGLTGAASGQIGGGSKVVDSGSGLGTGGFDSLSGPIGLVTPRYYLFTGTNTRFLKTKNISERIRDGGFVVISFIQGNSGNGGENPDAGEDLSLDILNSVGTVIFTHVISFGALAYVGNAFTDFVHKLTDNEAAQGVYLQIRQNTSSQSTFDTYGVKYFAFEQNFYDPLLPREQTSIPNPYFSLNNGLGTSKIISEQTNIGWDIHFNAYGNAHIGLFDGYLNRNYNESGFNTMNPGFNGSSNTPEDTPNIQNFQYVNKIYLGSDDPLVEYNNITNRFEISNLHTPERVQNPFNALMSDGSETDTDPRMVAEFPTQGDIVYKINKRLYNNNFTPDMMPYNLNNFNITAQFDNMNGTPQEAGALNIYNLNQNLQGWNIFDQLTGIIIKDFGYTSETWNDSLFGIMGFSYEQFNSTVTSLNDITTRVGNSNKNNLPYAFTNANINSVDTIDFPTNTGGSSKYTLQIPITQQWNNTNLFPINMPQPGGKVPANLWWKRKVNAFPAITEAATSVKLSAQTVPRAIRTGYYAIRSDVVDTPNFIGGPDSGFNYPILQCLSKVNDTNDWWVGGESSIEYSFTKTKTITEIRTAITTPDMRLASIEAGSSILYKLTRYRTDHTDIIGEILNEKKSN